MTTARMQIAALCISLVSLSTGQRLAADEEAEPAAQRLIREVDGQLEKLRDQLRTQIGLRDIARSDGAGQAMALASELVNSTQADIDLLTIRRDLLRQANAESSLMKSILESLMRADRNHSKTTLLSAQGTALAKEMQRENQIIREEARRRASGHNPLATLLEEAGNEASDDEPGDHDDANENEAGSDEEPGDYDHANEDEAGSDEEPGEDKAGDEVQQPRERDPEIHKPAPAYRAPLLVAPGDVILAVNGRPVTTIGHYFKAVNRIEARGFAEVTLRRGDERFRCGFHARPGGPFRKLGMVVVKRTVGLTVTRFQPSGPATNAVASTTSFKE